MNRLSVRIATAIGAVALAAILAVGGALFVSLRDLHRDQTIAGLGDIAQPLVARIRLLEAGADLRRAVSALESELRDEILVAALVRGRVVDPDGDAAGLDIASIALDDALRAGQAGGGSLVAADGTRHLYAATVVRPGTAAADASAIVLVTADRSGALALRDVLRVLPGVVLVVTLVAVPIAWLLGRSVTRPLRRLADATADVPAGAAPLPESGPAEVRELVGRFNAMTAELERTRAEERELLANVRHDLRTPLTVVAGFAEALRDGTVAGDAVPRAGRAIAEEADRMQRLVDDLGTADAGASGRELRPEPLDGGALVAAAAERFAGRASAGGAVLRAQAQGGAGAGGLAFAADRAAVERILANLVDNALRAIPATGTVLLEALPAALPGGGPAVALRVSDDGPGFPPGAVDRVFDRFYRGDPSRAGTGAGLGLAIVRTLARAHGGEAVAENLAPTGARVTVTFPVVPAAHGSAAST